MLTVVARGAAGVAGERRLGRRVVGHPWPSDAGAATGPDVDYATALVHVLDRLADPGDNPGVVHGGLAIELADVYRGVADRRDHEDGRVVDEDGQAAKFADHVADQTRRLFGL